MARENISEEDTPSWVNVQEKLLPRNRQVCLDDKLLKKLWMTKNVIRERESLFLISLCCHCVTHPF